MTIALLGSVVFLVYLTANFLVAKTNEQRIQDLQRLKFPLIENLILLKDDVDQLREALTNAIILENHFLIEDALELAPAFDNRLTGIEKLMGEKDFALKEIRVHFATYKKLASELAQNLVESPDDLKAFSDSAANTNEAFAMLNGAINHLLADKQIDYAKNLEQINKDINSTNLSAALAGLAFVIGLVILTWTISNKVILAIEKADKLKEVFLTTISHELRTPMNGIIGALSLLKRTPMEEAQRELVNIANQSSTAMIKTVDDILAFTEMMSGEPRLSVTSFTQDEWTGDLVKIAANRCKEKNLTFNFRSDLENKTIVNDKGKLINVCRNLLENAIKYTEQGVVSFSIEHVLATQSNNRGLLTVRFEDNGPGISDEFLAQIFKPFSQAEGGFKRSHQGMGIGLAMSNVIVNSLGGRLSLKNKADSSGTIAEFSIPSHFLENPVSAEPKQQTQECAKETPQPTPDSAAEEKQLKFEHHPNILIVEDNKVNQLVLSKLVKQMNCTALLANNGQEGVQQVQAHQIDLILMDCQMPVMDGFEATEAIRHLSAPKNLIPIVAVTANAREEDRNRCFEVGMNGFLCKPVDFRSVRQAIEEQLSNNKTTPTPSEQAQAS